jgi:hypothetical protein
VDQKLEEMARERARLAEEQHKHNEAINRQLKEEAHRRHIQDPFALKNLRPPRTETTRGECGVSSVQILDGEDDAFEERRRRQHEQAKLWCVPVADWECCHQVVVVVVRYLENLQEKYRQQQEESEKNRQVDIVSTCIHVNSAFV